MIRNRWDCPGVYLIGEVVIWDGEAEYLGLEPLQTVAVQVPPDPPVARPRLTPAEQAAWDDIRATPGILLDDQGNVIFDAEARALGVKPFKNRAEIDAAEAEFQKLLLARRKEREAEG